MIDANLLREQHLLLEQHLNAGRLDQAESLAEHLLARAPADIPARVSLARLKAARGDAGAAEALLAELVAEAPEAPEPPGYLAVLLDQRGERQRALQAAERSYALGGGVPAALVLLGERLLDEGRLDDALDLFERALELAPQLSGAWLGRARVMAFRGALADAEDAYIHAVEYGPQRLEAWVELVQLERDAGAVEVAEENLAIALRTHPGHPDLVALSRHAADAGDPMAVALEELRTFALRGDSAGALLTLDRIRAEHGHDPRRSLAEAEAHIATGAGDPAPLIHELTQLVREQPNAWEPKAVLGRLLLRPSPLLNARLAVAHCEDAWRTSGEHPYAGLGLVEAWATVGKRSFAAALCRRLAEGEGPEAEVAQSILAGRFGG